MTACAAIVLLLCLILGVCVGLLVVRFKRLVTLRQIAEVLQAEIDAGDL